MITRRQLLAITVVTAGLSASRIPLLPAGPIEAPTHDPSAGFGRKLWIALGNGEEIEFFGRQPVTFHVDDQSMVSNEVAIYFRQIGSGAEYEISTFHIFDDTFGMIFEGTLVAPLRLSEGWAPEFAVGALVFDRHGVAQA